MEYSKNPSLMYMRVSDDEVVVKGSHLEGFSLLVTGGPRAGLVGPLIDVLDCTFSAFGVLEALGLAPDLGDEISAFLEELASAGALVRHGDRPSNVAEWISFLRYGWADASAQRHSITVVGGSPASNVVKQFKSLGFEANHVDSVEELDLAEFVIPDASMDVAARMNGESEDTLVSDEELPDDDLPRLAVMVEGAPLSELYGLNEKAVAAGVPILYAQIAGSDYAIGPQVVPGATVCFWEFERQRARSLFSYSEYAVMAASGGQSVTPQITSDAATAAALPYLVELALLGRSMLAGHVIRGRATTAESSKHAVMRLPRCPTCLAQRPILRNLLF